MNKQLWIPLLAVAALAAVYLYKVTPGESAVVVGQPNPHAVAAPNRPSSMLSTHSAPEPGVTPSAGNVSMEYRRRVEGLRNTISASPSDTASIRELADLLFDAHSMPDAVTQYEAYLKLRPKSSQAWLDLATALGETGAWDSAARAMRDMMEWYPDAPAALFNLGAISANAGRMDESETWFRKASESGDPEIESQARMALERLNR